MDSKITPADAPPSSGWIETLVFFGSGGLLLYTVIHWLLPAARATGVEPVLLWFLLAGSIFILPVVIAAAIVLRREHRHAGGDRWRRRLRLNVMSRGDWLWTVGAMAVIGILSVGSLALIRILRGEIPPMFFVDMQPLGPGRYWILAAWLPFFVLNVFGEEFVWRGVLLPRQEKVFGRRAWLINGVGHLLLHLPTGWFVLFTLWPTALILPYVVQRRRNTWIGVVIHAALNGPGFLAVAFGLV